MKRLALILAVIMAFSVFAGCSKNDQEDTKTNAQATAEPNGQGDTAANEQDDEKTDDKEDSNSSSKSFHYAFEFTDVNGKVHKLSDYEGKPVYLEIWGSWCSVCMAGLEDMNNFAGEDHDYYVLSVVFPGHSGEKEQDEFITWYEELGYKNLVVMFDNDLQIIRDYGITGFPSSIFFDSEGNFAGGQVGQMSPVTIDQTMMKLVEEGR